MFAMMRFFGSPHDGVKQSVHCFVDPDVYALSPSVKTTRGTFATLSARSTLSTIRAVNSSPFASQRAISPAPIITAAPASATTLAGDAAGGGVGFAAG